MLERRGLHSMQAFSMRPPDMLLVYSHIKAYLEPSGTMVVILRNRIQKGEEVDAVGNQIALMRFAGFELVGAHGRDLVRPTGYQQWKVAKDPTVPWVRWEWAVVAR
jgi:hypothetical protein